MNNKNELLDAEKVAPYYWLTRVYYLIIPCALVFGVYLCHFNEFYLQYERLYEDWIMIQEYALFGILGGFIISLIPKVGTIFYRKLIYLLTFCLILSELFLGQKSYRIKAKNERMMVYYKLNCEELEDQFAIDRTTEDFVFWAYGHGASSKRMRQRFKDEYDLDVTVINAGCSVGSGRCYNQLLMEYLEGRDKK